jgi:glycerophosphoryl diester phosphodiesterase
MKITNNIRGLFFIILLTISFAQLHAQELKYPSLHRKAKSGDVYVIAHRGAHVGIPENSLPAIKKAIELHCDFVEIDTRLTKDGHIVSVHNSSVDEYVVGSKGKVNDFTLEEIKKLDIGEKTGPNWKNTRIPTIEEILQVCKGKIGIYLDLKESLVGQLIPIIRKYGMEQDIVWYIPVNRAEEIKLLQKLSPRSIQMPDPGPEENIEQACQAFHPQVMASDMGQLNASFVQKAHQNGTLVFVDENKGTAEEWSQILEWGTDGIQTDDPEKLISFLKRRKSNN